ncbi:Gp138 family membrane-puncturing spike protein [Chitiniphilus shinanonensis]|uniref:Gp138 family membrane-puncturing spike protein n=1 Tax=Chitiniphilus shinanonensis TaxID=553088 RepID=UPI00304EEE14
MIQIERSGELWVAIQEALTTTQSQLWTALPGIIQSFDAVAMTCTIQPGIRIQIRDETGAIQSRKLPLLLDCPVVFPGGGGCTLTFPVKPGDECLVVFASRCIDSWWQSGNVQEQADLRMHDLSDGFALVGVRSQPRALPGISTSSAQLRSDNGSAYIDLNPASGKVIIIAPGGFEVVAPTSEFSAKVTIKGLFSYLAGMVGFGQATSNGKRTDETHTHSGVQTGPNNSGPVA